MAMKFDEKKLNEIDLPKLGIKIFLGVILFILIIYSLFASWYIIGAGERGVLLTFGKPSMDAKQPGFHFKIPFVQSVVKMEVRSQKYEADAAAASHDLQVVSAKIATNYHLVPESVPRIYSDLGLDYANRVISPLEQEIVKSITSQFTAEELITRREEVRLLIKQVFTERLRERNIIVEEVSIVNFDFSESFNNAIEAKVTAEQLKLKAERDLERIKVEKEQTITQAEALAQSIKVKADADAYAIEVVKNQLANQGEQVLSYNAIQQWNGVLPQVTGENIPLIAIPAR